MTAINTRTVTLEAIRKATKDASYHQVSPKEGGGYAIVFAKRENMETFFDSITELAGILQRENSGLS